MTKYLLFIVGLFASISSIGQGINSSDGITPMPGLQTSYVYIDATVYPSAYWTVTNGTVYSYNRTGNHYNVTVLWSSTGTATLSLVSGTVIASTSITVVACAAAPSNATFSYANNCGSTTITRTGTPPTNITWYWQTTTTGTSTTSSATTYNVTSSGTYYLRSRISCGSWGTAQATSPITVNTIPSTPGVPSSTSNSCGPQTLTKTGSPPSGVSWYWQGINSSGTDYTSGTATATTYSATVDGTATYYLSPRSTAGCWGTPASLSVLLHAIPSAPTVPAISTNTCDMKTATKGTPPSGVSWYWQGTNASGQDNSSTIATASTYSVATNGTYYINALSSSGCWSATATPFAVTTYPADITVSSYDPINSIVLSTHSIRLLPGFATTGGTFDASIAVTSECNDFVNWNEQLGYDQNGSIVSRSRTYLDGYGNQLQNQSVDYQTGKVWASQPLYDNVGNPSATTLPAPILESDFLLKRNFIQNAAGQWYGASDFDKPVSNGSAGEIYTPNLVGNQPGTVGWYYSSANNLEGQTPTTGYPYSRTYTPAGPNPTMTQSARPGDYHRMGAGHEGRSERFLISSGELTHYYSLRSYFSNSTTTAGIGYKTINTDQDGKQTATFIDGDGHTVATAMVITANYTPSPPVFTYDYWSYTYFNDAGQVTAKVAPNGVIIGNTSMPNFVTTYQYNQLGRLISSTSPDGGTSQYVYSTDGKIRFSQNQEQYHNNTAPKRFSYTNYDNLGRLIESGEYTQGSFVFEPETVSPGTGSVLSIVDNNGFSGTAGNLDSGPCTDVAKIYYDSQPGDFPADGLHPSQTYLYGQVAKTTKSNATTWYSYDEYGRVVWTKQNFPGIAGFGVKTIDYTYDYFGNVTQIAYQQGQPDAFYHHYVYDINQRLTTASTSKDGSNMTLQATYYYYLHGPLKRVELATNLQGVDYVYNINGSIKAINSVDVANDPGADGSGVHAGISQDIFGMTFNYYDNDYTGASYNAGTISATGLVNSYSGLIKSASWFTPVDYPTSKKINGFTYDSRNQFQNSQWGTLSGTGGNYAATFSPVQAYKEGVPTYDKNGNIQALQRNGKTGNSVANYGYVYEGNTNRLDKVNDNSVLLTDYAYNSIGQMTQQVEGTSTINVAYNAYGLTKEIRDGSNNLVESFGYDDHGNRVQRTIFTAGTAVKNTFYTRDASGNVIAIYDQKLPSGPIQLVELPIYGIGRLGEYKPVPNTYFYEMTDHLGNVRAVIGAPHTDTFLATMETETAVSEDVQFKNIAPRIVYTAANNTPGGNEAVRVNNGTLNGGYAGRIAGPGISVKVAPGDVISIETYAYYEGGSGYSNQLASSSIIAATAAIFGGASGMTGDPGKIFSAFNQTYTSGGFAGGGGTGSDTEPAAYLNMIMFDQNLIADPANLPMAAVKVTSAANFARQKLTIGPITIPAPGIVYIYVNDNSNVNNWVYFDDLKVTQLHSPYVAGGDFYPYGLAIEDRQIKIEQYRFGYQGQFAEKDTISNKNIFQLRTYEPRYGRWLSRDPRGEFSSPFVGNGNDPVNTVDPTGGDIIILSAPKGAHGFGHNGLLVSDSQGGWTYISKDGGAHKISGESSVSDEHFGSLQEFLKSTKNLNPDYPGESEYTEGIQIHSTFEEDKAILSEARSQAYASYGLVSSNCLQTTTRPLVQQKILPKEYYNYFWPNLTYNKLWQRFIAPNFGKGVEMFIFDGYKMGDLFELFKDTRTPLIWPDEGWPIFPKWVEPLYHAY